MNNNSFNNLDKKNDLENNTSEEIKFNDEPGNVNAPTELKDLLSNQPVVNEPIVDEPISKEEVNLNFNQEISAQEISETSKSIENFEPVIGTNEPIVSEQPKEDVSIPVNLNNIEDNTQTNLKKKNTTKDIAIYILMILIIIIIILLLIKCCVDVKNKGKHMQTTTKVNTNEVKTTEEITVVTETTTTEVVDPSITETTTTTTVPVITGAPNITTRNTTTATTRKSQNTTTTTTKKVTPTTTTTRITTTTTTTTKKQDVYTYSVVVNSMTNTQIVKLYLNGTLLTDKVIVTLPNGIPVPGYGDVVNVSEAMYNFTANGFPAIKFAYEINAERTYQATYK